MAPNELYYFVPGQVILHIEHDEMPISDLEAAVEAFLKSSSDPWVKLALQWDQTITFPYPFIKTEDNRYISLVLTQFKIPDLDDYRMNVYDNQDILIELLIQLYGVLGTGYIIDNPGHYIFIHYISPNWLTSGSPHQPAMGGPGSWPVPADPKNNQWGFTLPGLRNPNICIDLSDGNGVNVAILDTAHIQGTLVSAYSTWPHHPLVNGLLGPHGMLTINGIPNVEPYRFSDWEIQDLKIWDHFSPVEHRYQMPDHGLFVAGIIHTIAEKARLKLYQVLNTYGVGCYQSIYTGLDRVLKDLKKNRENNPGYKLIINMSLVFNMPVADYTGFKHCDIGLTDRYYLQKDYIIKMTESIQAILKIIVGLKNVLVVAAAGNDARCQNDRPAARYPAAFPGVIGVGALPRGTIGGLFLPHKSASYSNLCDQPPYAARPPFSGYVTLGGEPGEGKGILGVYIFNEFPNYEERPLPNRTGWAWWAGTSFAAPIISGMLAAGWSNNWCGKGDQYNFLNWVSGNHQTTDNERVIVVTQT